MALRFYHIAMGCLITAYQTETNKNFVFHLGVYQAYMGRLLNSYASKTVLS